MGIYAQMECAMPRDPKFITAGWQARAVYVEAVLYGRENLTDGVIDRRALVYWMPDMPVRTRSKHLDALVAVGALLEHDEGWQFPPDVWAKWNPSRAEVEEKREAERRRKQDYRDRKRREAESSADVPAGQDVAATSRDIQPEPEPEREPEERDISLAAEAAEELVDNQREERRALKRALVDAIGRVPSTGSERGAWGKATEELHDAGATPGLVHQAVTAYRAKWPDMACTPNALTKHWSELLEAPVTAPRVSAVPGVPDHGDRCETCAGSGWVFPDEVDVPESCPDCTGSGMLAQALSNAGPPPLTVVSGGSR